ncbi:MAG: hypothetical protein M3O82_09250 [Verrucomicrobiota bacterium]|nr:hypothetical protein [Verrucomicrobiota bacterium]
MNVSKTIAAPLACAGILLAAFLPVATRGEAESDSAALVTGIKDVRSQQATLSDNQKKIDEKIAAINEQVRVARIFVSRGGKAK